METYQQIPVEILIELHERILAEDPTAQAELSELLLPVITERLEKIFPKLFDPDLIDISATDALLSYFEKPNRFQSSKQSLENYLVMSARGDLLNSLKPRKVDENSHPLLEDVELWDSFAEDNVEGYVAIDETDVENEVFLKLSPLIQKIKKLFPDSVDQELVRMLMLGIRETEKYAKVLGIEHFNLEEQKNIVKRNKDRIKKTIIRNIDPNELRNDI